MIDLKARQLQALGTEARDRYTAAQVAGAVARGELRWSVRDRIDRLALRAAAHRKAGRLQAAAACKRAAQRIADTLPE